MLSADTHEKEQGAAISTHQQDPEKVRPHIGIRWHLSTEGTIGNYKNFKELERKSCNQPMNIVQYLSLQYRPLKCSLKPQF